MKHALNSSAVARDFDRAQFLASEIFGSHDAVRISGQKAGPNNVFTHVWAFRPRAQCHFFLREAFLEASVLPGARPE